MWEKWEQGKRKRLTKRKRKRRGKGKRKRRWGPRPGGAYSRDADLLPSKNLIANFPYSISILPEHIA